MSISSLDQKINLVMAVLLMLSVFLHFLTYNRFSDLAEKSTKLQWELYDLKTHPITIHLTAQNQTLFIFKKNILKASPFINAAQISKDKNVRLSIWEDGANLKLSIWKNGAAGEYFFYAASEGEDFFTFMVPSIIGQGKEFRLQALKDGKWVYFNYPTLEEL